MKTLSLLTTIAAALVVGSTAYSSRSSPIEPVAPANRLSDQQLFARDIFIQSFDNESYINLSINAPGRVYISYVATPPSDKDDLLHIRISGNSEESVGYVYKPKEIEIVATRDIGIYVHSGTPPPPTDSLLVEIELYKKNHVREIYASETTRRELVILENVLYAPVKYLPNDKYTTNLLINANNSVFIVDPKAEFTTESYGIGTEGSTLQIELAAFNSTTKNTFIGPDGANNITLFVDRLGDLDVRYSDNETLARGLCISAKNDVNMTERIEDDGKPSSRIVPKGSSCVKRPIPEKVPGLIGGGGAVRMSNESTTKVPTTTSIGSRPFLKSGFVVCFSVVVAVVAYW